MNTIQFERLNRTNDIQKSQLLQYKNQVQCLKNDLDTYKQLLKKQTNQKNKLNQQIFNLKKKIDNSQVQRQQTQNRYYRVVTKLEEQLQKNKIKYDKLQSKIAPLIDHDSVRLKVLTEFEYSHSLQIQKQKRHSQSLKDQILKLKRQNALLKHKLQTKTMEFQQQIRRLKQDNTSHLNSTHLDALSYDMCKEMQHNLKINYQHARRQAQYYKDKYFALEKKYQEKMYKLQKDLHRQR